MKEFIAGAYRDGQIFHESGDDISSSDYARGVRLFNDVLRNFNLDRSLIAFRTQEALNMVPNTEVISVNFSVIEYVYYLLGSIKLHPTRLSLSQYEKMSSVVNGRGPPGVYYAELQPDFTTKLSFYFKPNQSYQFVVVGKRSFPLIGSINDAFPTEFETYRSYLKYSLAILLRCAMQLEELPLIEKLYSWAKQSLMNSRQIDTKIIQSSIGSANGSFLFADLLSMSGGWRGIP